MKPAAAVAAVPPLELLTQPLRPTRVLFRGAAAPLRRVELCSCRRDVVEVDPDYPGAVCARCFRRERARRDSAPRPAGNRDGQR